MKWYRMRSVPVLIVAALLTACVIRPEAVSEDVSVPVVDRSVWAARITKIEESTLLDYHQSLTRLSSQELQRERAILAAIPTTPTGQVRMAMLLGQARAAKEILRALSLLDGVLKSVEPEAVSLHPLVRVLCSQYNERMKLEMQNDRLTQQLKENQRRSAELQEKIDALADIERTLPVRPAAGEHTPGVPR